MIGRRNHKKSRTGCTECKRRKVKCDEKKPTCFNCDRYGAVCSLSRAGSASSAYASSPRHDALHDGRHDALHEAAGRGRRHDGRHEAAGRGRPPHGAGGMPILSLSQSPAGTPSACSPFTNDAAAAAVPDRTAELMHHWCTVTADTVATSEDQRVAWKVLIPRQGYEHPFVMHALLCVAALHRAYLSPIQRGAYLDVSARYQVLASEAFRAFLPGVTAENMRWKPVLCFARIIGLYIMCMPFRSEGGRLLSPIFNTTELIASLKAIVAFVRPYRHLGAGIEYGAYHGVYEAARQETSNCVVPPDTRNTLVPEDTFAAIAELRVFITDEFKDDYDRSRLMAYSKSVDCLETAARLAVRTGLQAEPAFILYWSSLVEEAVVADICAYRHPALILLAHFFVLFAMLERQFWFTRGWAKDVVRDVDARVRGHPRMERMMRWPLRRVWEHAL